MFTFILLRVMHSSLSDLPFCVEAEHSRPGGTSHPSSALLRGSSQAPRNFLDEAWLASNKFRGSARGGWQSGVESQSPRLRSASLRVRHEGGGHT